MEQNWSVTLLMLALILGLCWFLLDKMIWGVLSLTITLSLLAAAAEWFDESSNRKTGTRLFIWFLNQNLLLETVGLCMGLLTGMTGTLTGLQYAISADVMATILRWFNKKWALWKHMTLIEDIYKSNMPIDWKPGEDFKTATGFSQYRQTVQSNLYSKLKFWK